MDKKRILVVDDNRVMLQFLKNLLQKDGHDVETAEDGFAALDIVSSRMPDIIFLDLIMPKIPGNKLCQIVRKMDTEKVCTIVILSAAAAEIDFNHRSIGADHCIAKGPFNVMAKNIRTTIHKTSKPQKNDENDEIVGLEDVFARQMTKELLSRNKHLETIIESISDGILEIHSGRIVYANRRAMQILNQPQESIIAKNLDELFLPEKQKEVQKLIEGDDTIPTKPLPLKTIEIGDRMVTMQKLPIKGEQESSIVIMNDISETRHLEMQLQHKQKMEAIGTIASGVAHNFRNTLAGIMVNAQILEMNKTDKNKVEQIVDRIITSINRGTALVDGLTQFSRKAGKSTFQPLDLVEIIDEIYELVEDSFDKKIQVRLKMPDSIPVSGDKSSLSQVFLNLCTNARDAMPEGGDLTIESKVTEDQAEIIVADTGCGMGTEVLTKCFDPFFTTKSVGEGTGLGLSTTYGIIKNHGGTIHAFSETDKGTRFVIRLPLLKGQILSMDPGVEKIQRGSGQKILVVDDDPEIIESMPDILTRIGYDAKAIQRGKELLPTYRSYDPDLVLLDINMPDVDGGKCAEQLREEDPKAKIVIISGYPPGDPSGLDEDRQKLVNGYLLKPIEVGFLARSIASVLADNQK